MFQKIPKSKAILSKENDTGEIIQFQIILKSQRNKTDQHNKMSQKQLKPFDLADSKNIH